MASGALFTPDYFKPMDFAEPVGSVERISMSLFRGGAAVVFLASAVLAGVGAARDGQNVYTQDMDRAVRPGDDFYRYANGGWLKAVGGERTSYDTRAMLNEKTSGRVRELIVEAAATAGGGKAARGSAAQKVGDYYASFVDEGGIEAKGLTPLADEMARIAAIHDKASLSAYLGGTLNTEVDGLTGNGDHVFGVLVNQSFADAKHYVFHLLQGGLGMPDRDSYIDPSPKMAELRAQYQAHIAAILRLAGVADAESEAAGILSLEIRMAQAHAPDADAADVFKQNNPWKRSDFAVKAPGMDWGAYFKAAGVSAEPEFIVWQPSAVTGTAALVGNEGIELWKDYLRFHLVEHYASVLPKVVGAEDFAFYGTILTGTQQAPERSAGAIAATNAALGQAVGQLYVQRYFPAEAKAKAQAMVGDLIAAYRARIANLSWMSAETKKKALAKLGTLRMGLGYPDQWIDYSTLDVVRGDAFGNLRRAEAFNRSYNLAKLKRAADPDEWRIDPQIVGAVIVFTPNTETFSAGILQAPYFDYQGDAASNYGSAGAGMAHEITHVLDELGNIYDEQGRLVHWWTEEDVAKYHAAAAKLAAQIDGYCPLADLCVNGKQVLSESSADLAGLQVAHDAYILSLKGKSDVMIGGLSGEQRFFLAFSQRWRKLQPEAALRRQTKTDTHLAGEYRSDTVRHIADWYKAYEVASGDKLYMKPEDRVGIW
jgi:predicted metalloendopeptidase